MRSFIASAALVAGVAAHGNGTAPVQYTTEIVTAYTTYCPAATQITHGAETYTVTEATTLTITNCPCTVTKPVISTPVVVPTSNAPVVPTSPAETHPVVPTTPVETHVTPITSVPTQAPVVPATSAVETHVSSVFPVETHVTPVAPITTGTGSPVQPPVQPPVSQPIYGNSTVPAGPTGGAPAPVIPGTAGPSGTASPSGTTGNSPVAPFQGAAPKMAASGASLAGLLGLAAFFL